VQESVAQAANGCELKFGIQRTHRDISIGGLALTPAIIETKVSRY